MKTWIETAVARTRTVVQDIIAAARMNGEVTQRTMRKVFG